MDLSSQRGTSEKTLFKYLNTLAEWFIADSFQGNIEERTRARMLASGIIISWCGLLPFVALLELVFIGHPDAQLLALAISLSSVFIWVIGLLSLRFLGSFSFCVHLVVFSGIFCISIAAYFTGGIYSPVLIAIILPPVIASVLASVPSAFAWGGFNMAVCIALYALDKQNFFMPSIIPESLYTLVLAIFYGFACFLVLGVIYMHEHIDAQFKAAIERERKKMNTLAHLDGLTGLANRLRFDKNLKSTMDKAIESGRKVGIIYIDLDDFKPVNDTYGHEAGDQVLKVAAERMRLHIRSSDTAARLGGDEFAVILDSVDGKARVKDIANLMVGEINAPLMFNRIELHVGASAGISLFPDDACDIKGLLDVADKDMYANKQQKQRLGLAVAAS